MGPRPLCTIVKWVKGRTGMFGPKVVLNARMNENMIMNHGYAQVRIRKGMDLRSFRIQG